VIVWDASDLRAIGLAVRAVASAEDNLSKTVRAARRGGRSWAEIGLVLGVTQDAMRHYGGEACP
jgi:hypothetical protein